MRETALLLLASGASPETRMNLRPLLIIVALSLTGCPTTDDDDVGEDGCDPLGGDEHPEIVIEDPSNSLMLGDDDPINWVVRVTDSDGDVSAAELRAFDQTDITPVDLKLDLPTPGSDGRASFSMEGGIVGPGVVTLKMQVTDDQGCNADDLVVLCIDVTDMECPSR